jgi:hypothetical protein
MRAVRLALVGRVGGRFVYPAVARAHEKWFVDAAPYPTSWLMALRPPAIVGVAVAIVLTFIAGRAWHALDRRASASLEQAQQAHGIETKPLATA